MWLIPIGLFIHVCIILSLLVVNIPRSGHEPVEVCDACKCSIAERCVVFVGHGFPPEIGRARAKAIFRPNMFQTDGMQSILAGIPGYSLFGQYYPNIDNLLSRADNVVYFGPETIANGFQNAKRLLAYTYSAPDRFNGNVSRDDEFVINSFHSVFPMLHNSTDCIQKTFRGKTIIMIYLSSVAINSMKYSSNSEKSIQAIRKVSKYVAGVERTMHHLFPTGKTVFLAVPDWKYLNDKDAELQAWGCGISAGYLDPVRLEDVCPLIASVLGIPVPLGSLGALPESFLQVPQKLLVKALTCNALQLYQVAFPDAAKCKDVHELRRIFFGVNTTRPHEVAAREIIESCQQKIHSIKGSYDFVTFTLLTSTLLGWTIVILTEIMVETEGELMPSRKIRILLLLFLAAIVAGTNLFILYTSTFKDYRYVMFYHLPMVPWFVVIMRYKVILNWCNKKLSATGLLYIPVLLFLVEMLVLISKGGFWAGLGISVVALLPVLPVFQMAPYIYSLGWYGASYLLIFSIFVLPPFLSDRYSLQFVNASGTILMCFGGGTFLFLKGKWNCFVGVILIFYLIITTVLCALVVLFRTLHSGVHIASWVLLSSILIPLFGQKIFRARVLHTILAFSTPLMLTSRKLESVSFAILGLYAFLWVFLERCHMDKCFYQWHGMRRGLLLYFSCLIGYLLVGKLDYYDFYDKNITNAFTTTIEIQTYFCLMLLRYLLVFTALNMIYVSLIKRKWHSDTSFLYAYLFAVLVCLRHLCHMFFLGGEPGKAIFNNIFSNVFGMLLLTSYIFGHFYAATMKKPQLKTEEAKPA